MGGWAWNIEQGMVGKLRLSLPSTFGHKHTHRHAHNGRWNSGGTFAPAGPGGTSRPNMGLVKGVSGFLIVVQSITQSVYAGFAQVWNMRENLSESKIPSYPDALITNPKVRSRQSFNCHKTRTPPAIRALFQVMKINLLIVALILWPK